MHHALARHLGITLTCVLAISCSSTDPDLSLAPALDEEPAAKQEIALENSEQSIAPSPRPLLGRDGVLTAQTQETSDADERGDPARVAKANRQSKDVDATQSVEVDDDNRTEKRPLLTGLFGSTQPSESSTKATAPDSTEIAGSSDAKAIPDAAATNTNRSSADPSSRNVAEKALDAAPKSGPRMEEDRAKADPETVRTRGLLSALFTPAQEANPTEEDTRPAADTAKDDVNADPEPDKSLIALTAAPAKPAMFSDVLPGVRESGQLFEIRSSGGIKDASLNLYETEERSYQVASASGIARLAPRGLQRQRPDVDISCFQPKLLQLLSAIERKYGKRVLVTSGYRSPAHNKRVRGAANSFHMACAAADIQVAGVSKWELASFVRSLPGRGGVGTYCHTRSVHVDVGPERDWNWRCRR